MSEVKKIPIEDLMDFVCITSNAYPSIPANSKEEKNKLLEDFTKIQNEYSTENFYGLYREDKLLGGMLLHDFKMNFHSKIINAGGLGSVAVEFLHKKEHVAKELVEGYLNHYKARNVNFAILYPFLPSFYMKMGFGYGTKMSQYRIEPSSFPKSQLRKNVSFLGENDKECIKSCYDEFVHNHHGMIEMSEYDYNNVFKNSKVRVVGYHNHGSLEGFIFFSFIQEKDNFLVNDIAIHKLIYNSPDALMGLFGFLSSQIDQLRHVILNTQDESIYHMLSDPMNGTNNMIPHVYHETNVQGVGIMYRIIDVENFFNEIKDVNFNNINCKIKLTIEDDFLKDNNKSLIINFIEGLADINNENDYDVEIKINITLLSSLVMGVVSFKSLYQYSLVEITDIKYLQTINKLFMCEDKPMCMTGF